jgi:hypothetical protein
MIVRRAYEAGSRRVRLHCPPGIERRQGTIGRYQAMSPRITRKRSLLAADGVRYGALRRHANPRRATAGPAGVKVKRRCGRRRVAWFGVWF